MFTRMISGASARRLPTIASRLPTANSALKQPIRRYAGSYQDTFQTPESGFKALYQRNRVSFLLFFAVCTTTLVAGGYGMYLYNELVEKPLSVYPKPVQKAIKSALFYASRGDMGSMAAAFKEAISEAEKSGMHPLSNEVAGLKIECAQLLLKLKNGEYADKAVIVLERVLDEDAAGAEYYMKQERWADRNTVLKRAILLGYKIGEMYQTLGKDKEAEEAMSWSTTKLLEEDKRRETTDPSKWGGEWFDDHAKSACFEKLAQQYLMSGKFNLATPLYLQAASLVTPNTCHQVTLLNNLAACLSKQSPPANSDGKKVKTHLQEDAKKWAEKALELANKIVPPVRTAECDEACVTATHNLGEIARMMGQHELARRKFEEAGSLARGLNMQEGVEMANEGLALLMDKEK
ncbi:Similar to TPR repeat-containing protein P27G11.02; acc. no. Q9P7N6 [Pyronema omphalodes CBS 100304]|uniref:Similar to TPR repeat-containing protein P27G11.02 acc. no. Q9P7N6 n=1 Tax=Pyronema omphalodes (strain CBS 100304) TaxID=1076935 RepID=U4L9U0_PYROM|nr:Similar to TPR repeat-containing protein P27G11.02; acc. no. Q9P7N6 [Pyronema omphalodes CBS 100304]